MRLRLLVSFILIVLVSITSTIFLARQGAARGVQDYFLHGGITSLDLAENLEQYYASQGSWQGVSALLEQAGTAGMQGMMGRGQGTGSGMGQRLRVANASGVVVADTAGEPGASLSQVEQNSALELTNSLGATIGYLFVEGGMGYRQGDELPLLNRLNAAGLQAALIACSIALILAFFLAYQLGRPVQQLTRAALRLAKGDLNQQVKTGGGKELTSLGQAFNQMAANLKQVMASRRAMTADIAHELRTPLAVQRAQLEALQDGIYPLTMDNLQPLVEQNIQLSRLVDDLRTLALADSGELVLELETVDLQAEITRAVNAIQPQAEINNIQVECIPAACPEDMQPSVDSGRLQQILGNLLNNAIRHTPEGGLIRVENGCESGRAWIKVADSGQGIPEESLPHVFERFYRADRSRSRTDGGTGLGLAIARQLAEAHHGTLTAANLPNSGAVFTLTFPL